MSDLQITADVARRRRRRPGGRRAAGADPRRRAAGPHPGPVPDALQRLQRVQESGLAECGGAGEPIYLAWRQFLRGHGPSVLVIDATGFDVQGTRHGHRAR